MPLPELTEEQRAWYILKGYEISTNRYGDRYWYKNGLYHREDGPAIEYFGGSRLWYLNGKLHREDGPAVEYFGAGRLWYLNGEKVSEEEHKLAVDKLRNHNATS